MATLTVQIAAETDDGYTSYGTFYGTGAVVLGTDYGDTAARGFFRFAGLAIPQGSTINSATLTIVPQYADTGSLGVAFAGHNVDNSTGFTTATALTGAALTAASTTLTSTPAAWTGTKTVNVAAQLAAVVSRSGWASGNAFTLVTTNSGTSGNGYFETSGFVSGANRATLAVDYTAPSAGTAPVVNAGADATVTVNTAFTRTATETGASITTRAWTIVSGPAGAGSTIGTVAALTWTPSTAGNYVLRYSATNANGTGTDDVAVTVTTTNTSRPYLQAADWNWRAIGSNPSLDSNSAAIVAALAGAGQSRIVDTYDFGVTVRTASASDPKYQISFTAGWGNPFGSTLVPIPAGTPVPPGSDGHVVIIDPTQNKVFALWQANLSGTTKTASYGAMVDLNGDGRETVGTSTGSGLSRLAGIIRLSEMQAGVIPHALFFSTDIATAGGVFRYPATTTDGSNGAGSSVTISEGTRVQLDPSINLSAIPGISQAEIVIGTALQQYGAYCGDNGGARMAFIAEYEGANPGPTYAAKGLTYDYFNLSNIPWGSLRVLSAWDAGTQSTVAATVAGSTAAVTATAPAGVVNTGTAVPVTVPGATATATASGLAGTARAPGFALSASVDQSTTPPSVRIDIADTRATPATSVVVTRQDSTGRSYPVRTADGGPLVVSGGTATLYDNELPYGTQVTYSVNVVGAVTATARIDVDSVWLTHPGVPSLSVPVDFRPGSFSSEEWAIDQGVFNVLGRSSPVVVTSGARTSPASSFTIYTETLDQLRALKQLFADGSPLLLNVSPTLNTGLDTSYITASGVTVSRPSPVAPHEDRDIAVKYQVVDRPTGGTQSAITWSDIAAKYATWADVAAAVKSWAALANPTN